VPVLDQFQFLGPNLVPATDPAAFLGQFARARAVGSFSGTELGFRFQSEPG
jgi:hypothetical protein